MFTYNILQLRYTPFYYFESEINTYCSYIHQKSKKFTTYYICRKLFIMNNPTYVQTYVNNPQFYLIVKNAPFIVYNYYYLHIHTYLCMDVCVCMSILVNAVENKVTAVMTTRILYRH